ncbi:MAG: hypothetical protein EA412_08080 [Chitinophagaceae bacterium]|nr:MAG: hypothetical protein EA412_08080 [Chitinophagaceae bacterium]
MKVLKTLLLSLLLFSTLIIVIVFSIYFYVKFSTEKKIYTSVNSIPETHVALVLGTSKHTITGRSNLFFQYRIEAAAELYHSGKVNKLLLSGDNRFREYNEPRDMREALMQKGVPDSSIVLDYAGFRTFDSVLRAKKVFGQKNFIIVSQSFHLQRALFIANSQDINAIGFKAKDPPVKTARVYLREIPARIKAFLDCYILNTEPYFLGDEEFIY